MGSMTTFLAALYLPLSQGVLLFDIKEQTFRLVSFETFDQSDEEK